MKKSNSIWGEYGSFWGFLCDRRPGVPTVFDVAAAAASAEWEIKAGRRRTKRLCKELGLPWDEKLERR